MQRFLLIVTVLISIHSFTLSYAQESYSEDSPIAPNERIRGNASDETPGFPRVNELAAEQTYMIPDFSIIGVQTYLNHDLRPAFQVVVPNVESIDAGKAWGKMMKGYGAEVEEKEAIIVAKGARISDVHNKSINVYAKMQQKIEGTGVIAMFEVAQDEFIGDDDKMTQGVELFMTKFATTFAKEDAEKRLKSVEKELKRLEGLLNKLKRQNEGFHKDIVKSESGITKSESTINLTDQKQDLTESAIEAQEESEAYLNDETAAKELKKKNKELKKLRKAKERNIKNIDKQEQNIIQSKENIEENEKQQKMVQESIINQRQEVRNAQKYLKLFN